MPCFHNGLRVARPPGGSDDRLHRGRAAAPRSLRPDAAAAARRRYRAARRHSRAGAHRSRSCCPALAVRRRAVFWASARFIPSDLASLVSIAGIDVEVQQRRHEQAAYLRFRGHPPRLRGHGRHAPIQSLDDPKVLTFEEIDAHIGLDDGRHRHRRRRHRRLQRQQQHAGTEGRHRHRDHHRLFGHHRGGRVDLGKGSLASNTAGRDPQQGGHHPRRQRRGDDRGKHIIFRGGVSVTYMPPAELAAAPEAAMSLLRLSALSRRCRCSPLASLPSPAASRHRRPVHGFQPSRRTVQVDAGVLEISEEGKQRISVFSGNVVVTPRQDHAQGRDDQALFGPRRRPTPTASPASRRAAASTSVPATRPSPARPRWST